MASAAGPHERRSCALPRTHPDQHGAVGGQARHQREDREEHQSGEEHRPGSEPVGEHAAPQGEHRGGDRVDVDHPLQPRKAETKITPERGQRDRHRVVLEDDEERRQGGNPEHPPPAAHLRRAGRPRTGAIQHPPRLALEQRCDRGHDRASDAHAHPNPPPHPRSEPRHEWQSLPTLAPIATSSFCSARPRLLGCHRFPPPPRPCLSEKTDESAIKRGTPRPRWHRPGLPGTVEGPPRRVRRGPPATLRARATSRPAVVSRSCSVGVVTATP